MTAAKEKTNYYFRDVQGNVLSIYRKSITFGQNYFFCEEQTLYGSARLGTEQVEHSMRGLVTKDGLTDAITRAREQHGDDWQQRLQEQYEGNFYERLQDAWGNEWNTRLDLLLQGNNDGWLIEQIRNESYTLQAGNKRYELSNHLGNVLAVVSDKKEQTDGVTWSAVVLSATDYYPFGMAMPGRTTDAKHRYGFNGKETDPETGIQDYGMRWYLPNIARFPSVDPLTASYPWYTPYQFAGNTPIQAIDLDGAEPTYPQQPSDAIKTSKVEVTTASSIFSGCNVKKWMEVHGISKRYNDKTKQLETHEQKFAFQQTSGGFGNDAIWRMSEFMHVNHSLARDKVAKGYPSTVADKPTRCYYDCVTAVIAASKLMFNDPSIPNPNDKNGTMTNWLTIMHSLGYASELQTVTFRDANNTSLANGSGTVPVGYHGHTLSQTLDQMTAGRGDGTFVFGVSLIDGWHSIIITLNRVTTTNAGGQLNTVSTFQIYDQWYWGGKTEGGYSSDALNQEMLKKAQENYVAPEARTATKSNPNMTIFVSELKPK